MRKLIRRIPFPYIVALFAIVFTITIDKALIPLDTTSVVYHIRLKIWNIYYSPFADIRYGYYLSQKFFLVIVGFIFLFYWIFKKYNVFSLIKRNIVPLIIIAIVLFGTRIFSYQHWFYRDDYYIVQQFMDKTLLNGTIDNQYIPCCGTNYYPTAIVYLIIRWFTNNFFIYKTFGLIIYFFNGVLIFAIAKKFNNNKIIALLAALFFLTTPTYFQETLLVGEFIGDAFALLLYLLSIYLLLDDFAAGSIVLAIADLEMGLTRTHFIAVPLFLIALFLLPTAKNKIDKIKSYIRNVLPISVVVFVSFLFVPILTISQANTYGSIVPDLNKIFVIFDSFASVAFPFSVLKIIANLSIWLVDNPKFITVFMGISFICLISLIDLVLFIKKRYKEAKLVAVGIVSFVAADIVPAMWGIRVNQDVNTLLTYYLQNQIPSGATGYGLFPSIGLVFILLGFSLLIKKKLFKVIVLILIFINIITFIRSDQKWIEEYSGSQRYINDQLNRILPEDGKTKLIFVPENKNHLYLGIIYYQQILRVNDQIEEFTDPQKFVAEMKSKKVPVDHLYLLNLNEDTLKIYNFSQRLKNAPQNKYLQILVTANKEKI